MTRYANTAAYRFVRLDDREALRARIHEAAQSRQRKITRAWCGVRFIDGMLTPPLN